MSVNVGPLTLGNERPIALFAGLNVLESRELAVSVAEVLIRETAAVGMPLVFKASFDKANRSSIRSFRGPGSEAGLRWLAEVRAMGVPVLTDIHTPEQALDAAEVVDLLQIPAFLCRQTDLLAAACATGKPLHIKKMQMMAPMDMQNVVEKCRAFGAENIILCERGTAFGYGNLVVDPLSFPQMKALGVPVSFDVTHSLQLPGGLGGATGGRRQFVEPLALSGVSQGIAALFLEVHPDPDAALCDGPCALPLARLGPLLRKVAAMDRLVKGLD